MSKPSRQILALAALGVIYVLWMNWWASAGFPLEGQICEIPEPAKNCGSYNVFFYSAYRLAAIANEWGTLVTALATIVIAFFTATLWYVTRGTLQAAIESIELSRNEFLATNRPLLRVRYFKPSDGKHDARMDIRFTVVNVGKSAAHLLGSSLSIGYFLDRSLPAPFYAAGLDVSGQRKFEIGASDEYIFTPPRPKEDAPWPLHVYGYLVYADGQGNTRTTAFCRRWHMNPGRFGVVDDPDYEYED
jgi:hypothetical protein